MRISDWSSDVCSADLRAREPHRLQAAALRGIPRRTAQEQRGQDPAPRTARRITRQGRLTTASASGASRYGTADQADGPYPKPAPWRRKPRKNGLDRPFCLRFEHFLSIESSFYRTSTRL